MTPLTVRGYRFRRVAARADRLSPSVAATYVTDVRAGDALVAATTRERTLVDCLARLDLICVGQLKVSAMRATPSEGPTTTTAVRRIGSSTATSTSRSMSFPLVHFGQRSGWPRR